MPYCLLSCRRSSLLPELRVLHERVIGVEQRQDQARHPVAKPLSQRIHLDEGEDRMRNQLMHMESPTTGGHLLRHECRIPAHLPQIFAEVAERVLQDMAAQVINPARHVESLMHKVISVPEPVLVEKLWLPVVRVPAAVPDPPAQKKILPRHKERIGAWAASKFALNFFAQLARHTLVGVDAQHPVVRDQLQRPVAEFPEAGKVALVDLVGVFPADLLRVVGAVGIKDYDLIGPDDALEGVSDLCFLVEGEDVSRKLRHVLSEL